MVKSTDTITCDTLDIWARQTGDIDLTVNANIVLCNTHTTADVTLHGKSSQLGIYHSGEGFLYFEHLQVDFTWTHSVASGDEYLNVYGHLWATIDWIGNIYYTGSPAIALKGVGEGQLIHQN